MKTVVWALILSALVWAMNGTQISAASIEELVMPGAVISGHEELESDCGTCHSSFSKGAQDQLCLDCHEDVAADVESLTGFHGISYKHGKVSCNDCHTEHIGRSADIIGLNPQLFQHDDTDFPLLGSHQGLQCGLCHEENTLFRDAKATCFGCHEKDEPHHGELGDDCASCHSELQWVSVDFDHSTTDFALKGAHVDVICLQCHVDQHYQDMQTTCVSCHQLDDVHNGTRGDDCADCHSSKDWRTTSFDHDIQTDFPLTGLHSELECSACHLTDMQLPEPPDTCIGCHSAEDPHQGRNGDDCTRCHNTTDWEEARFDHSAETDFDLNGAHTELACTSCHEGYLTDELPDTCAECHEKDDPHQGEFGDCEDCHNERTWHDVAFNHDFTAFPLIGFHRPLACESCHEDRLFKDASEDCVDCHADDDFHEGSLKDDCGLCHNPNGWNRWQFDHNTQTEFSLDGAHEGLECALCHEPGSNFGMKLQAVCISCHRNDDSHKGRFGSDCGRCHTTSSFHDVSLLQ